jgi:ATP-binding protein involved in chromosome partitioning
MVSDREQLLDRVRAVLAEMVNARTGMDLVTGGQIRNLAVAEAGHVSFQIVLGGDDSGAMVREARKLVESVPGVSRARIDVKLPQVDDGQGPKHGHAAGAGHGKVPAPARAADLVPGVRHIVAISSGKGGVGKSTVASNLAAALAAMGHRVGLLDADIYGPDIPLMFGERRKPQVTGTRGQELILPIQTHGVALMSLGFLLEDDQPAVMRGPMIAGILRQFLEQVAWGDLDVLIVDMPPGTGDAQLSLVQTIDVDGAVMVTTPQEVSTADVRRAIRMFERVKTPILGVVENMSGFCCPHCQGQVAIFGVGGGQTLADSMKVPYLGSIPLEVGVREAGDAGKPTALATPESPAGQAIRALAERLLAALPAMARAPA